MNQNPPDECNTPCSHPATDTDSTGYITCRDCGIELGQELNPKAYAAPEIMVEIEVHGFDQFDQPVTEKLVVTESVARAIEATMAKERK